jgi:chromosome segregation ATPase
MRTQLEQRLAQLKSEYETGQKMLADLEHKQRNLCDTLLRISGAIQVLEEELSHAAQDTPTEVVPPNGAALHLNT